MKHYEYEIILFLDSELEKENQKELFTHLTLCEECRTLLYEVMDLKNKSKKFYEGIIPELNEVLLPTTTLQKRREKNIYRPLFYFATAACFLLGFLFLLNKTKENELQNKLTSLEKYNAIIENDFRKTSEQKLNAVTLKAPLDEKIEYHQKNINNIVKKVPPKSKTTTAKPDSYTAKSEIRRSDYAQYLSSLKTERITKNDFLIPQLIGN
ncbi:MAG: hypothetical protein NTX22_11590 [Ignavibacteriales bacterium]|nr:hypothetical protein [Ignavibacteriales bacterium]